jgi:hypothetical protein
MIDAQDVEQFLQLAGGGGDHHLALGLGQRLVERLVAQARELWMAMEIHDGPLRRHFVFGAV